MHVEESKVMQCPMAAGELKVEVDHKLQTGSSKRISTLTLQHRTRFGVEFSVMN